MNDNGLLCKLFYLTLHDYIDSKRCITDYHLVIIYLKRTSIFFIWFTGLYMPTDNAHSILMNRYFSGLGSVEREAIYNSMPCCAANETIPFTILYKDHKDQLVTETLPKAVKTNCACS